MDFVKFIQIQGDVIVNYLFFERKCKECGTTPTALSSKLGLSKGNASNWKKGGNPSVEVLIKIADELNCTVDSLLGRESTQKTTTIELPKPQLTENEEDLIMLLNQLSERDQVKLIGKVEEIVKEMNKSNIQAKESVG